MMYHPPLFTSGTIAQYFDGLNEQTSLAMRDKLARNSVRRVHWPAILFGPALYFFRTYIVAGGYKAGARGLTVAMCESIGLLLFIAKAWEYRLSGALPGSQRPPVAEVK